MAGLLCKFIGLFYRVPLSYLLGAEGIGLYQMAYPVFAVAAIVAAGGLPLAMAKHMAEHLAVGKNEAAWHLFQVGRLLLWAQGLMSVSYTHLDVYKRQRSPLLFSSGAATGGSNFRCRRLCSGRA